MTRRRSPRRKAEEDDDDDLWAGTPPIGIGSITLFTEVVGRRRGKPVKPKHPLGFQPPHTRLKEAE